MRNETETSVIYPGWRVVCASMIALAFGPSTVAVMSLGLFMSPLEKDFGWPRTDIALATTIVSYMIVVVSPLQGYLIDRYGARRVMLPSIIAFALGISALSRLPPVHWVYYAAWASIPVLGVGLFPLGYLKTVGTWFTQRLGLALGLANCGIGLGTSIIPFIVGGLIAASSWRRAYEVLGLVVLLVTFPIVWGFVRERPIGARSPAADRAMSGADFSAAVATGTFRLLTLAYVLLGVVNTALIVHQVPLLIDGGVTPLAAARIMTVFGLAQLGGRLVTGVLLDRIAAPLVMVCFAAGAAVSCAVYAAGYGPEVALLCALLLGLAFGAEFDVLAYVIKQHFGLKAFGRLYGLVFALFQLGAGCGAAFLPLSRDWAGGSYAPGLWTFVAVLVLCALTMAAMPGAFRSPAAARISRQSGS